MSEIFKVKVARLGSRVEEVSLSDSGEATVKRALQIAVITPGDKEELRLNGEPTSMEAQVEDGDVLTLVPQIRGGF